MHFKPKHLVFILTAIFFVSLFLRAQNVTAPFWVDEFSTAEQAKLLLNHGLTIFSQTENYFEPHNITTHFLVSASFSIFGIGEWQARVPFIIIGSLVSILIFIVSKKFFNDKVAIISSLLYTFSYWQITWARQARGYVLQQLAVLVTLLAYQSLLEKYSKMKLLFFITVSILGLLTHTTFVLILLAIAIHFMIFNREKILGIVTKPVFIFIVFLLFLISFFTNQINSIFVSVLNLATDLPNNLSYYHSFLWRQQTITVLFAFIGICVSLVTYKKFKIGLQLLLPISLYLFFVCFLFMPYVSRYILPIFPLLFIFAGVAIDFISTHISKKLPLIFGMVITLFIVVNGDTFTIKPRAFYSVNRDMREVAIIDYDSIFEIIQSKGNLEAGKTAVIDTWPDRVKWYLGENKEYLYTYRWINSPGTVNGLSMSTPFEVNELGEKIITSTGVPPFKLIGELSDLEMAMSKYEYGFIWIDDTSLPQDIQVYVKENFHKELYLESYPPELLENPYSIWPGTLYSWGFETPNPSHSKPTQDILE